MNCNLTHLRGDNVKKKIISLVTALALIVSMLFGLSTVVKADDSGSCGTRATYTFDEATGVLTVSGSGNMRNYSNAGTLLRPPWYDYKADITKVVIENDIEKVGNFAFWQCVGLTEVVISDSVTEVGMYAFDECSKLSKVTLGNSVESIGANAFNNTAITEIVLPDSVSSVGLYSFGNCSFLASVTVHNPTCQFTLDTFYNSSQTITFWGHSGSTIQTFVDEHPNSNYVFKSLDPCDHLSTHEVITVEPTCTEGGMSQQVCDECGFVLSETTLPAKGHTLVVTNTDDKSETDGHIYTYYQCENCDYTTTEIQHISYVDGYYTANIITEATCTVPGSERRVCNIPGCNNSEISIIQAFGHQLENVTVTKEPTCTEDGEQTGTCSICGKVVTSKIDKLGHDNVLTDTVDNTEIDGHYYEFYNCSVCGEETVDITHNEWVDGQYDSQVIMEPTCTVNGIQRDTCRICGETRLVSIPANGQHDWQETGRTEPTCISSGKISYVCSVCNMTKNENIPALGHDYAVDQEKSVAPTCTEAGSNFLQCQRCAASRTEVVAALGHTAVDGSYVIVTEPTCTEDGETTAQCSVCGESYTMVVSALGHDYLNVYEPLDDKPGHSMSTPTCSRCGDTQTPYVAHIDWLDGYYTTTIITQGSCTVSEITRDTCTLCGETRTNTVPAQGHKYIFTGLNEENRLSYVCSTCNEVYTANPSIVKSTMWNKSYINTAPQDTLMGYIFDLTGDGIINAKDYALLVKYANQSK